MEKINAGSAGGCVYCGKNPTPHFLAWYFESLDIILAPLRRGLSALPVWRPVKRVMKKKDFGWRTAHLLLCLGIVRQQAYIDACQVRRARVLWEEANKRGIEFYGLKLFGKNLDMYLAQKNGKKLFIDGLPRPAVFFGVSDIMDDKSILKRKLLAVGLPVARGGTARTAGQALAIFRSIDKPVIVKPRAGSRGRHTTTYISTEDDLRRAYKIAKQLCAWVVVEEQLFGPVYRGTVIGGRLAGVLRGDSPEVTGDGKQNITELITAKNLAPHEGVKDIVTGPEMELFLVRSLGDKIEKLKSKNQTNFKYQIPNIKPGKDVLSYVPEAGETVMLSEKVGLSYGGSSSEDFEICHPDNKELFLAAARAVGDPLVGFDYIIPDITKSFKEQRSGFIEANSLPFIDLHHFPLLGKPRNAAALVWDMVGMQ